MTEERKIQVIIVDDHAVVRRGIAVSLMASDKIELVGEAENGEDAIHLCSQHQPDVVLMDMMMPHMNGAETSNAIMRVSPHTRIIILTSYKEENLIQAALKAGAVGYMLKDSSIDSLIDGIVAVAAGEHAIAPEITQALISIATRPPVPDYNLTDREIEILALMVKGLNNLQIASQLVISRSTVKFHVSAILSKLGVASRTEAVALAIQEKLVS